MPKNNAEKPKAENQGALTGSGYEAEDVFENAEPWSPIETKMVLGSFGAALVLLIIFAYLIDKYILAG